MYFPALTMIASNMIFAMATLEAASKIHKCLLRNMLRLPMVFFDTTPVGRILGRFSGDIHGVDNSLPNTLQNGLGYAMKVCNFLLKHISTTYNLTLGGFLLYPLCSIVHQCHKYNT